MVIFWIAAVVWGLLFVSIEREATNNPDAEDCGCISSESGPR